MSDFALDQPRLKEYDDVSVDARFAHANGEIYFDADRDSDLRGLHWHWHGRAYADSIRIRIDAPIYTSGGISSERLDDVLPLALQLYPGYQETIYGVEGVIVSKRIFAPLDSYYDRSLLWMMEAQAEGDRLIQIRVEIDWGEPLEQRMVDGLLVAQSDPGEPQGAHGQRNAESTRVFGAAEGRPDLVEFPSSSRAILVYHVLVAGQVDLPLILALSDVGEQVAWNGFLVQRDISRAFKRSRGCWRDITHRGRLWSPQSRANRAVQDAKIEAMLSLARFRTGYAPANRRTSSLPALVSLFDSFAPERSRALLDTLRRTAERTDGALPTTLPALPRQPVDAADEQQPLAVGAYLSALLAHYHRHPAVEWLSQHRKAFLSCAGALTAVSESLDGDGGAGSGVPEMREAAAQALRSASALAALLGLKCDADRFGKTGTMLRGRTRTATPSSEDELGPTVWDLVGIRAEEGTLTVLQEWPAHWSWWALLELPVPGREEGSGVSLLWDGETLHTTAAVNFDGPVVLRNQVRAFGSEEHSFNLRFRLGSDLFIPSFEDDGDLCG